MYFPEAVRLEAQRWNEGCLTIDDHFAIMHLLVRSLTFLYASSIAFWSNGLVASFTSSKLPFPLVDRTFKPRVATLVRRAFRIRRKDENITATIKCFLEEWLTQVVR